MNKSAILNFNKNNILGFLRDNKTTIMLTAAFIIGIIVGCVSYKNSTVAVKVAEWLFDYFLAARQGRGFIKIFAYSFEMRFLVLLLFFLCGASLMGIVIVPLLKMASGFFYGILCAHICSTYLLKGIAFNALIVIPVAAVFVIALVIAAGKSIRFSFEFAKLTFPNSRPANLFLIFKDYCGYYLIYLSAIIGASIVDALLSKALISYFEFI
ncbi:MAG: hypothetical protein IJZ75_02530 [Clostridia bacterium]|nr:hypothetical protein [Clostridia bacterium]